MTKLPTCYAFIDFDDTVFPTSVCGKVVEAGLQPAVLRAHLHQIDQLVAEFVLQHLFTVRVYFVTRANQTWVNLCLQYLPQVQQV